MAGDPAHIDVDVGTEVDGYRITGVLGRGGMGVVYRAEDVALGRTVALKMIDPAFSRDEHFLRRFQSEARALARINEPHIVQVHALRRTEAGSFIVMECVDGGTLGDRMVEGPVPVDEAVPIIRQMLLAFGHAHDLGVIHRDIKPGNIMLTRDGMVKVTDFGLAKVQQGQPGVTVTQAVAGTLYYMSPEQVKGLPTLDHRSDLYAIGMTIYEMLAGRLPFERKLGEFATMRMIVEERFPPPHQFNAAIPPALSRIVMKALEKDPKARYESAHAMLADLEAFAHTQSDATATIAAVAARPQADTRQPSRRAMFIGAGMLALVLLAVLVVVLRDRDAARPETQTTLPPDPQRFHQALLVVNTTPEGARVRFDGRDAGASPIRESVRTDGAGVRVQADLEGYDAADTLLYPAPGETLSLQLTLAPRASRPVNAPERTTPLPGTLSLRLEGEGEAWVAGRTYGADARISLPPGTHDVRCGSSPHATNTRVSIQPSAEQGLTCYFEAPISIVTQMEDGGLAPSAAIVIDGQDTGWETPREIVQGPGAYAITVRKFGYEVLNEETLIIRPSLEPQAPRRLVFRLRETG